MAFELVQKAETPDIRLGSGFRHFSVSVRSIEAALQRAMDSGYEIVEGTGWEAGEVYIKVRSCFSTLWIYRHRHSECGPWPQHRMHAAKREPVASNGTQTPAGSHRGC